MSKYTTEVRFICESYAGLDESKGYKSINEILDTSAPLIFDFDYPIFDEDYKPVLEKRILKHFYTREISEETVGLWKLRLEDKMNLIMPYYNKMYESQLIQFNPLYDTDYTVDHSGNATDVLAQNDTNTRTFNKDTTLNETDGNTRTLNTQDAESNSSANKNVRWDLYSDTPEGGINGITADEDSVANNTYLTNARKITDDGTGSTSSRTVNNTGTVTDAGTRNNTVQERGTIGDLGSRNVNSSNLNAYLDKVLGKRGTTSYSKMLQEYRETFLRIDEMIVNELEPLFFGLWN